MTKKAAAKPTETVEGNLMTIKSPSFVSLVDKPANRIGFRVIRQDRPDGGTDMVIDTPPRSRGHKTGKPVYRNDSLISVSFSAELEASDIDEIVRRYGLSDDYERAEADGTITYRRKTADGTIDYTTMTMPDGVVAAIAVKRGDEVKTPAISVVDILFDTASFSTVDSVACWLTANSIEIPPNSVQRSDDGFLVKRHNTPAEQHLDLDNGVRVGVARSDEMDIPGALLIVNPLAFGSWGWGQLDFAAILADRVYSDKVNDVIWLFDELARTLLLYSALSVPERKVLISKATNDFRSYVLGLLDALPAAEIVTVRTDSSEDDMDLSSDKANKATVRSDATPAAAASADSTVVATPAAVTQAAPVAAVATPAAAATTRSDPAAPAVPAVAAESTAPVVPAATTDDATPVTRGELKEFLKDALKEVLVQNAAPVQRGDGGSSAANGQGAVAAKEPTTAELAQKLEALAQRFDAKAGTVVVRADDEESAASNGKAGEDAEHEVKRNDANMFEGVLFSSRTQK